MSEIGGPVGEDLTLRVLEPLVELIVILVVVGVMLGGSWYFMHQDEETATHAMAAPIIGTQGVGMTLVGGFTSSSGGTLSGDHYMVTGGITAVPALNGGLLALIDTGSGPGDTKPEETEPRSLEPWTVMKTEKCTEGRRIEDDSQVLEIKFSANYSAGLGVVDGPRDEFPRNGYHFPGFEASPDTNGLYSFLMEEETDLFVREDSAPDDAIGAALLFGVQLDTCFARARLHWVYVGKDGGTIKRPVRAEATYRRIPKIR